MIVKLCIVFLSHHRWFQNVLQLGLNSFLNHTIKSGITKLLFRNFFEFFKSGSDTKTYFTPVPVVDYFWRLVAHCAAKIEESRILDSYSALRFKILAVDSRINSLFHLVLVLEKIPPQL